jgi:uncharacterized protein DUF2510
MQVILPPGQLGKPYPLFYGDFAGCLTLWAWAFPVTWRSCAPVKAGSVRSDETIMTTQAGWYPDPQTPYLARWWDGQAWTAHTSAPPAYTPAPPAMPSVADPYAFALPTPPSRRGPVIGIVVIVVLVVVGVVAAIPVAMQKQAQKGPPDCGIVAPADASVQEKEYVAALHSYFSASEAYTKQVNAEGGANAPITAADYSAQLGIETNFLADLQAIQFTGLAAADADEIETAMQKTIQDLNTALSDPSQNIEPVLQVDYGEESNAKLRFDFGLPRYGTCSFWQA